MQSFIKRYLLVLFACWLIVGQAGLEWKSATCIFTGSVSYGWGTRVSCCQKSAPIKQDVVSRASCCSYAQFQVKLSAEQRFKIVQYVFEGFEQIIPVRYFIDKRFYSERILLPIAFISPPPPSVKRALIQVYLI